jgi:hypothetical protein
MSSGVSHTLSLEYHQIPGNVSMSSDDHCAPKVDQKVRPLNHRRVTVPPSSQIVLPRLSFDGLAFKKLKASDLRQVDEGGYVVPPTPCPSPVEGGSDA